MWFTHFRRRHHLKKPTRSYPSQYTELVEELSLDNSEIWVLDECRFNAVEGAMTSETTDHTFTITGARSAAGDPIGPWATSKFWPTEAFTSKEEKIRFIRIQDDPAFDWLVHVNEYSWKVSSRARCTGKTFEEWFGCTPRLEDPVTGSNLSKPPTERNRSSRIHRLLVIQGALEATSFEVVQYLEQFDFKIAYYPASYKDFPKPVLAIKDQWNRAFTTKQRENERLSSGDRVILSSYNFMAKLHEAFNKYSDSFNCKHVDDDQVEHLRPPIHRNSVEPLQDTASVSQMPSTAGDRDVEAGRLTSAEKAFDPIRDSSNTNSPSQRNYLLGEEERQLSGSAEHQPVVETQNIFKKDMNGASMKTSSTHPHASFDTLLEVSLGEDQPISIAESANRLAQKYADTGNTSDSKLTVFRALWSDFEGTAKQFKTEPERKLVRDYAASFLKHWNQALKGRLKIEYDPDTHLAPSVTSDDNDIDEIMANYTAPRLPGLLHHKFMHISKETREDALLTGDFIFKESQLELVNDGVYELPWTIRAATAFRSVLGELREKGLLPPNYYDIGRVVYQMNPGAEPFTYNDTHFHRSSRVIIAAHIMSTSPNIWAIHTAVFKMAGFDFDLVSSVKDAIILFESLRSTITRKNAVLATITCEAFKRNKHEKIFRDGLERCLQDQSMGRLLLPIVTTNPTRSNLDKFIVACMVFPAKADEFHKYGSLDMFPEKLRAAINGPDLGRELLRYIDNIIKEICKGFETQESRILLGDLSGLKAAGRKIHQSINQYRVIKLESQQAPAATRARLRRTNELLPDCKRPALLANIFSEEQDPLQTASQEDTAAEFQNWLQELPPLTLVVYSDGSQTKESAVGCGFTVHRGDQAIAQGSNRLGPAEVFDAEATGALEGFKAALSTQDSSERTIIVCLDNTAAATCLRGKPSDSSQDVFIEFQTLTASHGDTKVRWVPGHAKIPGNEEADALAKAACLKPVPAGALPTLAYLRRAAERLPKDAFKAWWEESAPDKYKALELSATINLAKHAPLLPESTAALSDETGTLTDCSCQPGNRQELHRVRQGTPSSRRSAPEVCPRY
ncbi:hypothetical protein HJFPF1_10716 [Paramyrothecium foliicola]|nr:hypothetical protein HJFPF1_10716 [Paramyrothecium foliicola]